MSYTRNPHMPKVRQKAVELVRRGWSTRKVGRYLGFHHTSVMKWVRKAEKIGYHHMPTESSRLKHHPQELSQSLIEEIVKTRVVQRVLDEKGIKVSLSSVEGTLDRS